MKPDKNVKDCLHQTDVEDEVSEDEKFVMHNVLILQ